MEDLPQGTNTIRPSKSNYNQKKKKNMVKTLRTIRDKSGFTLSCSRSILDYINKLNIKILTQNKHRPLLPLGNIDG